MKFPKMTKGTYRIDDEALIKCGCGTDVKFAKNEVFKFCSSCGRKHNKMRVGTSSYSYSGVMSDALSAIMPMCQEFYFESDVVTNGPGHRMYGLVRYHSPQVSAYIDASKGTVKMIADKVSVDVYTDAEGNVWSANIKKSNFDKISLEFSDEEIFKLTEDELVKKMMYEAKGLWSKPITKEHYETKKDHLHSITLDEASDLYADSRARKSPKFYIPKDMSPFVVDFFNQWIKVEEECIQRQLQSNFSLSRPRTIKRQVEKNGDAIVLTIRDRDNQDKLVMYSCITRGEYRSMNDFDFNTIDNKKFIVTLKGK
jgi:hypothetical protein